MAGQGFNKNNFAVIAGAVLVLVGLYQLALRFFGAALGWIWQIIGLVLGVIGPLVVIAAGVLLVVAARRDTLNLPANRKLFRSTANRKLAGVCGGIAEYFSADPALVRIITIVLGVISWFVIVPLYLLFWVIVPSDATRHDNWG